MADKLTMIREAIAQILDDDHVTAEGAGYRVTRGDVEFLVLRHPDFGDWRVFFGHCRPDDPQPESGIGGTGGATPQEAVLFVLL